MMNIMKRYWLYLEPYSFVFEGEQGAIVYNTLNSRIIHVRSTVVLDLVRILNLSDSGYCVELIEEQLKEKEIHSFIKDLRDSFSGDIVPVKETMNKPFIIKPILNLVYDPEKFEKNLGKTLNENLLHYLHEITLYLDFSCAHSCTYCRKCYQQFLFCTKCQSSLKTYISMKEYANLFKRLNVIGLKKMNLVVNNPFDNQRFEEMVLLLKDSDFSINLYIHYRNLTHEIVDRICKMKNFNITILADDKITEKKMQEYNSCGTVYWKFVISSEDEYVTVINDFAGEDIDNVELIPFYNGHNEPFFRKNVYTDVDDLLSASVSKEDIFARQVMSTNLFGKLIIMPDGEVYSNMNTSSLGNLKELPLDDLIYNEFSRKNSWLLKRDKEPCLNCVYRYLCPSPSNYELVMGRLNLCHIK